MWRWNDQKQPGVNCRRLDLEPIKREGLEVRCLGTIAAQTFTFRVQLDARRYGIVSPPDHHVNCAQLWGLVKDPEYTFSKIEFDVPR